MKEAVDQYLQYGEKVANYTHNTQLAYQTDLNQLIEFLQQNKIDSWPLVTTNDLQQFAQHLHQQAYQISSIVRKLATVRSFFTYYQEQIPLDHPISLPQIPNILRTIPNWLTQEQLNLLFTTPASNPYLTIRNELLFRLLYETGVRASTLLQIKLSDFRSRHHRLRLPHLTLTITPTTRSILLTYLKKSRPHLLKKENELLFLNHRGQPLTRQGLWYIFQEQTKTAALDIPVFPDTLRHSFAVHQLQSGISLPELQQLLDHNHIATTYRYLKVNKSEKVD